MFVNLVDCIIYIIGIIMNKKTMSEGLDFWLNMSINRRTESIDIK
jgi:hypothetical protein